MDYLVRKWLVTTRILEMWDKYVMDYRISKLKNKLSTYEHLSMFAFDFFAANCLVFFQNGSYDKNDLFCAMVPVFNWNVFSNYQGWYWPSNNSRISFLFRFLLMRIWRLKKLKVQRKRRELLPIVMWKVSVWRTMVWRTRWHRD